MSITQKAMILGAMVFWGIGCGTEKRATNEQPARHAVSSVDRLQDGLKALGRGDAETARQNFDQVLANPGEGVAEVLTTGSEELAEPALRKQDLLCYAHYGKMLASLALLAPQADQLTGLINPVIRALNAKNQDSVVSSLDGIFKTEQAPLLASRGLVEAATEDADYVLDQGCLQWSSTSQTTLANDVVVTKNCSTKQLSGSSCGLYLEQLPIVLKTSPAVPALDLSVARAAVYMFDNNDDFVEFAPAGEWDRGEALIVSTVGHLALAGIEVLAGIQTGTSDSATVRKVKTATPGIQRVRAYGALFQSDTAYLAVDPQHAGELNGVDNNLQLAAKRIGQFSGEFEGDLDVQSDDIIGFTDITGNGISGGDSFTLNLKNNEVKVKGWNFGTLVSVLATWKQRGAAAIWDSVTMPKIKVYVPPRVKNMEVKGIEKLARKISQALAGVDDAGLDDTIQSNDVGTILVESGLATSQPKGYFSLHLRPAFALLRQQGLRPFVPAEKANTDGTVTLQVENEVTDQFGTSVVNSDMKTGDATHFGSAVDKDCVSPTSTKGQAFYYMFTDPTFNGALEFNAAAFADTCTSTPATADYLINKWANTFNKPLNWVLHPVIQAANDPFLNGARALVIGSTPEFEATRARLNPVP